MMMSLLAIFYFIYRGCSEPQKPRCPVPSWPGP